MILRESDTVSHPEHGPCIVARVEGAAVFALAWTGAAVETTADALSPLPGWPDYAIPGVREITDLFIELTLDYRTCRVLSPLMAPFCELARGYP